MHTVSVSHMSSQFKSVFFLGAGNCSVLCWSTTLISVVFGSDKWPVYSMARRCKRAFTTSH